MRDGEQSRNVVEQVVDLPVHVVNASKSLMDLEKRDPETTKQVKRFYNPQVPADRQGMN